MGGFEVIWTDEALQELAETLQYYNDRNQSNSYSVRLKQQVEQVSNLLAAFPKVGRLADDKQARFIVIEKFLLIYDFDGKDVFILSFFDPKRAQMKRVIHKDGSSHLGETPENP